MEPISSPHNPKVVAAGRLHRAKGRRAANATLLEGPRVVGDAIASGAHIEVLFVLADDAQSHDLADSAGLSPTMVTDRVMGKLAATLHPTGPVAVAAIPTGDAFPADRSMLVMMDVSDPGNAGTLIRTAAAFGFGVASIGGADLWSPKVVRAAAGGHYRTLISMPPADLESVAQTTVATVASGGSPTIRTEGPFALYVGAEANGLPRHIVERADECLSIPMAANSESLNVAVAGAIAMYMLGIGGSVADPQH